MNKRKILILSMVFLMMTFILASCKKNTFTLTCELDGGTIDGQTTYQITIDEAMSNNVITLKEPVKEGYNFVGWYLEGTLYDSQLIILDKDITLVAKWEKISYQITYDLAGGVLSNPINSYTGEIDVVLPIPEKPGYEFLGWNDGIEQIDKGTTGNIELKANWKIISYSINYDLDGGVLTNSVNNYTCEDEVILPIPEKPGYEFLGWNDGVKQIDKGTTGNIELKANWNLLKYTITYHLDGGTLDNPVNEFTYFDEIVLNKPTKAGFEFLGWYLDANMSGNRVTKIEKGTDSNVDVYALWQEEKTISKITYVLNGGVFYGDVLTEYENGKDLELPNPEKESYLFMGWFEKEDLSGDPIYKINSTDSGDKVYYAAWLSAKEFFNNLIPNKVTENLNFVKNHPDNNNIRISWSTSDTKTINYSGVVNKGHNKVDVNITMTLFYKESYAQYTGKVTVEPVVFEPLKTGELIVGYVYAGTMSRWGSVSFDKIFDETAIKTLDVVNYGFATVNKSGNLQLDNTGYMTYIDEVLKLRQHGVRVLLCIAENSANFSDMASTQAGIDKFVAQVVEAVEKYHFDGVDIDWEFPGVDSGRDVAIDRPNYTKLMKALRKGLDAKQGKNGTPYLLTAAIPGTSWGSDRYELNVLDDYLDYVNMMSYDLNDTGLACHHSSLYTSKDARAYGFSIQYGVDLFVSKGFDKNKIVAGMAFYGKYYKNAVALGVDAKYQKNVHYTTIKKTYLSNSNFVEYWDDVAKASYLLNKKTGEFVSYDSPRSIIEKCKYAQTSGIKGVMFWDYSEDTTGDLMKAIKEGMNK